MLSLLIIGFSICIQVVAAYFALRLIKITHIKSAWILIAFAILLMALRRIITFSHLISPGISISIDIYAEITALIISILMISGIALIKPLFESILESQKLILESKQNLQEMAENSENGILIYINNSIVFKNTKANTFLTESNIELHSLALSQQKGTDLFNEDHNSHAIIKTIENNETIYTEVASTQTNWNGQIAEMVSLRNITSRFRNEHEMKKLSGAIEQTADSVVITDFNGKIEYVNKAFETVTGYSKTFALGKKPNIVKSGMHDDKFYTSMWNSIKNGEIYRDIFINRNKNGDIFYEEKTITPLLDQNNKIVSYISTGKDVTQRIQSEEKLHYLAYHDILTDLPNRALFMERIEHAIESHRKSADDFTICFMDLDNFKYINDTLGHHFGDEVLVKIASQLKTCIRGGDTLARFGGDEFGIVFTDISNKEIVSKIVLKILDALSLPVKVNNKELFITASIGICTFPQDGNKPDLLLKNADTAMYQAKREGKNRYKFYSTHMSDIATLRMRIESHLRHALSNDEFELYYQPQFDINSKNIIGAEALLRWNHPSDGLIMPDVFIPVLEDTGMIKEVGQWIFKTACKQIKKWHILTNNLIPIAINISTIQFRDKSIYESILQALDESDLSPRYLELEITESVLMENIRKTISVISRLSKKGISIAIDDFGTGYSSLSYLSKFKINTLKIDKSFIKDVSVNENNATIVKAIVILAKTLNLSIVAEGVENLDQELFLKTISCDIAQGYLYAKPVPAKEFEQMLVNQNS